MKSLLCVFSLVFMAASPAAVYAQEKEVPSGVDQSDILNNITKTGAKSWKERKEATNTLLELAKTAPDIVADLCVKTFAKSQDPEVRARLEKVLNAIAEAKFTLRQSAFLGIALNREANVLKVGEEEYFPINITGVTPETSADVNGLKVGDKIIQIDNKKCNEEFTVGDFITHIGNKKGGDPVKLKIFREKEEILKEFKLGSKPMEFTREQVLQMKKEFVRNWLKAHIQKSGLQK